MPDRARILRLALAVVLATAVSTPSLAVANPDPPVTEIILSPPMPDGSFGWWVTAPFVFLRSDQAGTAYWTWNSDPETSAPIGAGELGQIFIGSAPEGESTLSAYSVSSLPETGSPAAAPPTAPWPWRVDTVDPPVPEGLRTQTGPGQIGVAWTAVTDAGSGLDHYNVYRNILGPPFFPSDKVREVYPSTDGTGWIDTSPPAVDVLYYAVSAVDVAGNESSLSTETIGSLDGLPPTDPTGLQAWLNASGWCRVSWSPSTDLGTGMSHYLLYRSFDGGPFTLLTSVGGGATSYDDHDPAINVATTVEYKVMAVDRAENQSNLVGPALMLSDTAPPAVAAPAVSPVYSANRTNAQFDVSWGISDGGSGVAVVTLYDGPISGSPANVRGVSGGSLRVDVGIPTALWYFQLRAEDRAGNISAVSAPAAARNVSTERVAGANRLATSRAISQAAFASAGTVVFASANGFPDALAASALAGAVRGPVLLVGSGTLPADTVAELKRLGAANAYVVGGPSAVSAATYSSIDAALSGSVTRVAGSNRYMTASAVADRVKALSGGSFPGKAFIVSAQDFPDALSVAPAAYAAKWPILFATSSGVPAVTLAAISRLGITEAVIVGGTRVVSPRAEALLPSASRVAGSDRFATSRAVADWAESRSLVNRDSPVFATGMAYPDGLSAAPLAGERGSIVLLTDDASAAGSATWLASARGPMTRQTVVGGTSAVSDATQRAFWTACSIP